MTWKLTLIAVVALLIWLVACNNPFGSSDKGDKYGGPYLPVLEQMAPKISVFERFKEKKASVTETIRLDKVLLERTIIAHAAYLYGSEYQRYNFVVNKDDKIIVAKWINGEDKPTSITDFDQLCDVTAVARNDKGDWKSEFIDRFQLENGLNDDAPMLNAFEHRIIIDEALTKYARDKERNDVNELINNSGLLHTAQGMVNFHSDDPLDKNSGIKLCAGRKILDELTKHFMLAQGIKGADNEQITNSNFDKDWRFSEVAYAGEIIVDVKACRYTINNGSGTYTPDSNYLKDVAKRFGKILGLNAPAYQIDNGPLGKGPRKFVDSDKGALPSNWC